MRRRQGAREAAGNTGFARWASGSHARAEGRWARKGGSQGLSSHAHAHTRRTPGPPEACASLARCPLARPAARSPLARGWRPPKPKSPCQPCQPSAEAGSRKLKTPRWRPYLRRRARALRFTRLSNRPSPPLPEAAGHDGSVVVGAGSAQGGGEAETTIPTRPRA